MGTRTLALALLAGALYLGIPPSSARAGSTGELDTTAYPRRGLGFAAGSISGAGLSYKQHSGIWVGQVTGGLRKTTTEFDVNLGVVAQRTLHVTTITGDAIKIDGLALKTRFYGVTGVACFRERQHWPMSMPDRSDPRSQVMWENSEVRLTLHTGVGIGMEFMVFQRVGIAMDGVYDFSLKSVDVSEPPMQVDYQVGREDDGLEIQFLPAIAVHYYF